MKKTIIIKKYSKLIYTNNNTSFIDKFEKLYLFFIKKEYKK